eukprot:8672171-Ditylum_brightwellii.AAC.1
MALYANAAAVPTTLGGGAHGHIGLVMKAGLYGTLSGGTAYNAPPEPTGEQLPAHTAKDLTAALAHPPNTSPFAAIGDEQLNAIK